VFYFGILLVLCCPHLIFPHCLSAAAELHLLKLICCSGFRFFLLLPMEFSGRARSSTEAQPPRRAFWFLRARTGMRCAHLARVLWNSRAVLPTREHLRQDFFFDFLG
jgi:hypothetical protein